MSIRIGGNTIGKIRIDGQDIAKVRLNGEVVFSNTPQGYFAVFSFHRWNPEFVGTFLKVKRLSDNIIGEFGFDGNYLDVPALATWANGADIELEEYDNQFGYDVKIEKYPGIPPLRVVINPDGVTAKVVSTTSDGMIINNIPYKGLKIVGGYKGVSVLDAAMFHSSGSTGQPKIFQTYYSHKNFAFGVNNALRRVIYIGNYQAFKPQVTVFNNDTVNGITSIRNHNNYGWTENENINHGPINLGIGMDENGNYKGNGELNDLILTYDSSILSDAENTAKTNLGI